MKTLFLFLSFLLVAPFSTQATLLVEVTNVKSTESASPILGDNYYILDTEEVSIYSDLINEATLTRIREGAFSVEAVSLLIRGDWIINGNYIKFTVVEDVLPFLPRKGTYLFPIGTASDGKTYYIKMNFID